MSLQTECSRYFASDLLRPVAYAGSVKARRRMAERLGLAGDVSNDRSSNNNGEDSNGGIGCGGSPGSAGATPDEKVDGGATAAQELESANVVITSYNVLRTDSDVLGEEVCR